MDKTNIDQNIRYEAAIVYSNNNSREAINSLLKRINASNGWCDTKIWLMLLEIYQISGQQDPYEKLATYFANRFNFSPPAWDQDKILKSEKGNNSWRNALVLDGSPLSINVDKKRDFLRVSKELNSSRMDFSRMTLSENPEEEIEEIKILIEIMKRIRNLNIPTLFMGENETLKKMEDKIKTINSKNEADIPYWDLLFEILQWRGEEEKHDDYILRFINIYNYCPITYDKNGAVAVIPSHDENNEDLENFEVPEIIKESKDIINFIKQQWSKKLPAEINLSNVKKIHSDVTREIAIFLQENMENKDSSDVVFLDTNELFTALLETTGVSAFSTIRHRHLKLRTLYNPS